MSLEKRIGKGLLALGATVVVSSYVLISYEINEYNHATNSRYSKECKRNIRTYLAAGIPLGNLLSLIGFVALKEAKEESSSSSIGKKEG